MKHIKIIISFLLVLAILLTFSACIRIVPKDSSSTAVNDTPASSTADGPDWVLNNDDSEPTNSEPSGNVDQGFDTPGTVKSGTGQTTYAGTPPACDLVIQPDTLNGPPGVYIFTASTSTYRNAEFIWDIDGIVKQYGSQKTFTANLAYPGSGTVSVTLVVDGVEMCTATSYITITGTQQSQCDLQIYPATLNNVIGTYTFTATTSYSNAIFIWDINGSAYQPTTDNTFSVNFNAPGTGTVSVTMIVNGISVCTATSYVTISNVIIVK